MIIEFVWEMFWPLFSLLHLYDLSSHFILLQTIPVTSSLSPSFSISPFVSHYLSLSAYLSLSLPLYLTISLSASLSVYFSLLSISPFISLSNFFFFLLMLLFSGQNGPQRLLEGKNINQSLHALNNVFLSLTDPKCSFVNFRGSKLTQCLQVSLSGNSNISIICCITPSKL